MKPIVSPRDWSLHEFSAAACFSERQALFEKQDGEPRVGDLVFMQCAPASAQWLSVVVAIGEGDRYSRVYTLRGAGLVEEVNWSNAGLIVVDRAWCAERPRMFWTQEHWDFTRRLYAIGEASADNNGFMTQQPDILTDDGSVTYRMRYSHGSNFRAVVPLPDWRRMDDEALVAVICEARRQFDNQPDNEENAT